LELLKLKSHVQYNRIKASINSGCTHMLSELQGPTGVDGNYHPPSPTDPAASAQLTSSQGDQGCKYQRAQHLCVSVQCALGVKHASVG